MIPRSQVVLVVRGVLSVCLTASVGLKLHMMLAQGLPPDIPSSSFTYLWGACAAELVLVGLRWWRREIGLAGCVLFFAVGVAYATLVRADQCGCLGSLVVGWRNMLAISGIGGSFAVVGLSQCLDRSGRPEGMAR